MGRKTTGRAVILWRMKGGRDHDFFGCSVTVEFTVPEQPGEYYMLKVGGAWVKGAALYKKIGGVWVQQTDISAAFDSGVKYRKPE